METWGFLLDEDRALKEKLSGFSVVNYSDGKKINIPVFFRFPDPEERTRTFPHIQIDLVDVVFDRTRAHRAAYYIQAGDTETATPLTGFTLVADDMPLPWSLIYQITTFARQPWQDRQLQGLMFMQFPEQFGFLNMANYDNTARRADLQSSVRRDTVDSTNKRLYKNIFTVAISSEFYLAQLQQIQQIASIDVDVEVIGAPSPSS